MIDMRGGKIVKFELFDFVSVNQLTVDRMTLHLI